MRQLLPLILLASLPAQQLCGPAVAEELLAVPERSEWTRTSTCAEVDAFLAALHKARPGQFTVRTIGHSLQGRAIKAVRLTPRQPRLKAVIMANIHGGEVEGKEAVQVLLRELAMGEHPRIREQVDLWFVPIFNVDGNDEIVAGNRASQNGPLAVGKRSNSQSLDLNRDFVKAESPEVRALLGLLNEVDPHLFMDLHTTNGSPHGYHLTYSPSLATNMDKALDRLLHESFMPAVRKQMKERHGLRIFDYGNFPRRGRGDPKSWTTYDHKPRLAFNYYGLRDRIGILSEAYSYLPFRQRTLVTRAFVLECLREMLARPQIAKVLDAARARIQDASAQIGFRSRLRKPVRGSILVGELDSADLPDGLGRRYIATDRFRPVEMDILVRFEATAQVPYPQAWVLQAPEPAVLHTLLDHGVEVYRLEAGLAAKVQDYVLEGLSRSGYTFQGRKLISHQGKLEAEQEVKLAKGSYLVPRAQRFGRVAAQLLDPHSEDSLATWASLGGLKKGAAFPVRRVNAYQPDALQRSRVRRAQLPAQPIAAAYRRAPEGGLAAKVELEVVCTAEGRQVRGRSGFERGRQRFDGRQLALRLGDKVIADIEAIKTLQLRGAAILRASATVLNQELLACAAALRAAGCDEVFLVRKPE